MTIIHKHQQWQTPKDFYLKSNTFSLLFSYSEKEFLKICGEWVDSWAGEGLWGRLVVEFLDVLRL